MFELTVGPDKALWRPPHISNAISVPVKMLLVPFNRVMAAHSFVGPR